MDIESVSHKGLKRFIQTGNKKGLVGDIERLMRMLAYIDASSSIEELSIPSTYGLHPLTGNRRGCWAMRLTRNWRLTFILSESGKLHNLNLEDYHDN